MPATNRIPVAKDQMLTTTAGTALDVQLLFDDDDGPGPYSYAITKAPAHGELAGEIPAEGVRLGRSPHIGPFLHAGECSWELLPYFTP